MSNIGIPGWSVAIGVALAGIGCAGPQVRTDHDPHARFAAYRTFKLQEGQVINDGIVDTRNTLVRGRIDSALDRQLIDKGLQPTTQNPDLIVTYTASARWVQQVYPYYRPDDAYTWFEPVAYDQNDAIRRGTLVIDLLDGKTKQLVWRSVAGGEDKNFGSAEHIAKAVDKSMKDYPGTGGF